MLTEQEIRAIITIYRRAPLTNMDEAEAAAKLLNKLVETLAGLAKNDAQFPAPVVE